MKHEYTQRQREYRDQVQSEAAPKSAQFLRLDALEEAAKARVAARWARGEKRYALPPNPPKVTLEDWIRKLARVPQSDGQDRYGFCHWWSGRWR